jgi:putative DNA primase/helicase
MSTESKSYRERLKNVLQEVKLLLLWVCYSLEERYGQAKRAKVPYNPTTGEPAKANDPSTWSDFETCLAAVERGEYDGIGFELAPPYVGVDLDKCRNPETGVLEDWAADIIAHLDSYTEISPSLTGVHILVKGTLPEGGRRFGHVEMYDTARFFTVTGLHLDGSPTSIEERTEQLAELHEALFPNAQQTSDPNVAPLTDPTLTLVSDAEIIQKASTAANGEKFMKRWTGQWKGEYDSQSEVDEALCCDLAFWTGNDASRIDHLFRQSQLYRPKWERDDYRSATISRAIARTRKTYTMSKRERIGRLYSAVQQSGSTRPDNPANCPAPDSVQIQQPPASENCNFEDDFRYTLTDLGNSERFIRQYGHNLRYCVEEGTYYLWSQTRWGKDTLKSVQEPAKKTVRRMYRELELEPDGDKRKLLFKFIQTSESERSLNAIVNVARTNKNIAISASRFDTQLHLLNCKNGTIDLRTGRLQPHDRADLIRKQSPVLFDPYAQSEAWNRFLDECTRGDLEVQAFLRRAVGYTLFGDPREQVIFMVHGPGATGKSTFISAVMNVLGDYGATADFTTFLKKDRVSGGPSDDIANLAGARLVTSIEVDDGKQLAQALVKQLTGGDMIRARHLYQSSFEFKPQFTLWLVCNHAPVVPHDDDAIWRRILRLPFENVIPPDLRDKNLKAVLTDSSGAQAILAWAVQGCVEWYQAGLQVPTSVTRATESYKKLSNPLAAFVADECKLIGSAFTAVSDLRHAYDLWCAENAERNVLNRNQFTDALRDLGCTPGLRSNKRGWNGIALRSDAQSIYSASRKQVKVSAFPFGEMEMEASI